MDKVNSVKDLLKERIKLENRIIDIDSEIASTYFPEFAWPGGYPYFYYTDEMGMLCPACAMEWVEDVVGASIYEQGPDMECDGGCGRTLESAYGDPGDEYDQAG